jgi:hypothetical protein
MRATPLIAAFLAVFMLSSVIAMADTPVKQVALQGRLSDPAGKPLDGSFSVKFTIFNDPTATDPSNMLWSEAQKVTVTKGLFGVNLGSTTQGGIPLAFDKPYWVEVSIGAEKLSPRYPLTSAPYSFYGGVAGSIDASKIIGTLNANQIPALTADKILSVNPSTIVGTIPDSKIASISVSKLYYTTTDKNGNHVNSQGIPTTSIIGTLAAAQIPLLDINAQTAGTLAAARIPNLDAGKIATGTFLAARIPALDAGKITTGALATAQIPGLDAAKIISGTLDAARIPGLDAGKITTGALAVARIPSITNAMIANDAITGNKILNKTIEEGDIANGAVNTYTIQDGGIRHQDIAPFEITSGLINNDAVTRDKLDNKYVAGETQYTAQVGPGVDQRTKIVSDLRTTYGISTALASCTCSVPDDGTHKVYFCNCWVVNEAGTINAYANVFQSNGYAATNALIDWIIVER